MARGWIDKKSATHFTLVHRPQNDPLIHDENAPQMVLNPTQKGAPSKGKRLDDLASDLGSDISSIRDNEGEAANYGIYFDDTEYDYMQHMRDLNTGAGGSVWVEGDSTGNKNKGKGKLSLEDALQKMDLEHKAHDLLDEEILPSKNLQHLQYDAMEAVPESIAGFQPDMDPRLREVLEALEDDEFVDEEGDDIFEQLAQDGEEVDEFEFEETTFDDDDDEGWESDHTAKPTREYEDEEADQLSELPSAGADGQPSQDWMSDFKKFKKDQDQQGAKPRLGVTGSDVLGSTWTTTTNGGRRKKRRGALTNPSSYSMTSSSVFRNENLGTLDARFEVIEEQYHADLDDTGSVSAISTASSVQGPLRSDFDDVMDEFLSGYKKGRRPSKKLKGHQTGIEQLDEVRKNLGPARVSARHNLRT
ncbi:related to low-temperature viability protein LTV1 [Cephalotrichum gorgonifer]|uniref:Related to low-temperature viability protein LTV1 n=1 Tax=Cephalotrichum gorgonifer TaxID=2041049 RepID=A0AAE8MQI3_9PEZI|nr:related to low-temperature viability protein LTV1 [Cephalotrichum gorgonifer]